VPKWEIFSWIHGLTIVKKRHAATQHIFWSHSCKVFRQVKGAAHHIPAAPPQQDDGTWLARETQPLSARRAAGENVPMSLRPTA
jgi:hypothetical protein